MLVPGAFDFDDPNRPGVVDEAVEGVPPKLNVGVLLDMATVSRDYALQLWARLSATTTCP
jgi:hypothetical protein